MNISVNRQGYSSDDFIEVVVSDFIGGHIVVLGHLNYSKVLFAFEYLRMLYKTVKRRRGNLLKNTFY